MAEHLHPLAAGSVDTDGIVVVMALAAKEIVDEKPSVVWTL